MRWNVRFLISDSTSDWIWCPIGCPIWVEAKEKKGGFSVHPWQGECYSVWVWASVCEGVELDEMRRLGAGGAEKLFFLRPAETWSRSWWYTGWSNWNWKRKDFVKLWEKKLTLKSTHEHGVCAWVGVSEFLLACVYWKHVRTGRVVWSTHVRRRKDSSDNTSCKKCTKYCSEAIPMKEHGPPWTEGLLIKVVSCQFTWRQPCYSSCPSTLSLTRVIPGQRPHVLDPASVFLSTHWWSQNPACQRCFCKPLRKCHPSQRVSTPRGAGGKRRLVSKLLNF